MRYAALAAITAAAISQSASGAPVEREAYGMRLESLAAMEASPFDAKLLDRLSDWSNGDAPTAEELEGNVVMLVTFDANNAGSLILGTTIKRLEEKYAGDGLVVLGMHPREGWEKFQQYIERGMIPCRVGHDPLDLVRKTLKVDDDPDVYLVDRAGNMRYADVANGSIDDAVAELIAETAEHAAGEAGRRTTTEGRIAAGLERDPNAGREAAEARAKAKAKEAAELYVPEEAYASADWPRHMSGLKAQNFQGRAMPATLGNEEWLSDKVETEGKILVIDFWATWCGPCRRSSPILDEIQKKYKKEVVVLAISGQSEDERTVKSFLRRGSESYSYLHDQGQTLYRRFGVTAIPHSVIVSTDGVVRWQGNPLNSGFPGAVAQVVKADPKIQALAGKVEFERPEGEDAPITSAENDKASANVSWPAHNTGNLYAQSNMQGETLDKPLAGLKWMNGAKAPETEGKVIIIDFWATWCGPCKNFSPTLDRVQKKYTDDVVAVAISGQRDPYQNVVGFLEKAHHSYLNAHDNKQRLYKSLGVSAIPHVIVMSSDGVVRWQGVPGSNFERIVDQVVESNRVIRDD